MSPCTVAIAGFLSGIRFLLGFINNAAGSLQHQAELGSSAINAPFPLPSPLFLLQWCLQGALGVGACDLGQSLSTAAKLPSFFSPAGSRVAAEPPVNSPSTFCVAPLSKKP